ncbi:MAG: ABC transporter permease [Bacteroidales bacterium]|nr:ABC transporter permease [Bacteroidales bacterium]
MKLAIKMAYRNLVGAGLRTWLNVIVLSFSFLVIIWMKGIITGWDHQAKVDMTNWEIGEGQYWQEDYDPYDPFTFTDSHAPIPPEFSEEIANGTMEPVLIAQGTIYPQGRLQSVMVRGIDPKQTIFMLPAGKLDTVVAGAIPAIIGSGMAKNLKMEAGDRVMVQWRDADGTFDASEVCITEVFTVNVPAVDQGQLYLPLDTLQSMLGLKGEATIVTYDNSEVSRPLVDGWVHKSKTELTSAVDELIRVKTAGTSFLYIILITLAMLAIFDTQVLSIFRRQKEIGTYIALGYTRRQVVGLFTVEGTMYAVLAALLSAAYGLPFLAWQARVGWTMPMDASEFGMAIAQTLYPVYSAGLVAGTVLIIMTVTALVSYWPSRRIAKMNPTEALRGRIQ